METVLRILYAAAAVAFIAVIRAIRKYLINKGGGLNDKNNS